MIFGSEGINMKILKRKKILIGGAALCAIVIILIVVIVSSNKKPVNYWYVEQGLEDAWAQVLRKPARLSVLLRRGSGTGKRFLPGRGY